MHPERINNLVQQLEENFTPQNPISVRHNHHHHPLLPTNSIYLLLCLRRLHLRRRHQLYLLLNPGAEIVAEGYTKSKSPVSWLVVGGGWMDGG